MAIKNASDLLVYAKTSEAVEQVTRIYIKTTDPLEMPEGSSQGSIKINNITDSSGQIFDDVELQNVNNSAENILAVIAGRLVNTDNYTGGTQSFELGDYTYREFTNGATGIVPTLEIVSGTATFNEDAVIIEIKTPGSSAIFDPVAFSTSASFSVNRDLRDITNKDSGGWSESISGLKSFEVSTELLQSINPDVPLDGTDFFEKLKERDLVDLAFSDRIRNIIRTNLTQSGVDGFLKSTVLTQVNLQADPFGGSTASKLTTPASTVSRFLGYTIDAARVENKKVNWSFYVKGSGSTTQASFALSNSSIVGASTITKIEGQGTIASLTGPYYKITGLSTSAFTRISFQTDIISLSGSSSLSFYVYPGLYSAQDSDEIIVSSWQIEFGDQATNYQDPTDVTRWQGNALVSSLSFDAGVEDNLTCSATFTGTANLYLNGLGPELLGDTEFNLPNPVDGVFNPSSAYWTVSNVGPTADSKIENGLAIFFINDGQQNSNTAIKKLGILDDGDRYLLTYTIPSNSPSTGKIVLQNASENDIDIFLDITTGTHKLEFVAFDNDLVIKRSGTSANVFMSSISLKKVL